MDWPNNETIRLQNDPDTLRVPMDIQWFDERSANSSSITHHFHMNTTYGGSPFYNDAYRYSTGGMGSPGTGSLYMDVSGVAKFTTMWVYYSVTVSYTQGGTVLCSEDDMGGFPFDRSRRRLRAPIIPGRYLFNPVLTPLQLRIDSNAEPLSRAN